MKHSAPFCIILIAGLSASVSSTSNLATAESAQATLPVYEVIQQGVNNDQVKKLSEALKQPTERLGAKDGVVDFTDAANYLKIPARPVTDKAITDKFAASNKNEGSSSPRRLESLDTEALRKITVFDGTRALGAAASLFERAGLQPKFAKPVVKHTVFSASYKDESGALVSVDQNLDTFVTYEFTDPEGHPLTGPGAHVHVAFNSEGKVIQLHYAFRDLKPGPRVKIISEEEARARIAKRLASGATIDLKLVYWCPPFESGVGRLTPMYIIPWYSYTVLSDRKDPKTGVTSRVRSKERLIPATDDERFVPAARLQVSGSGSAEVSARAEVSGGRAPYVYSWVGSNPSVAKAAEASVRYTPLTRAVAAAGTALAPNQRYAEEEVVGLNVTDANGVTIALSQHLPVMAQGVVATHGGSHGTASYGCESPGEPEMWTQERIGWQQGMANPGGGTQEFCWLGNASWPGDYIRPPTPGALPVKPWINGDIDYANWGVNTANLVLINGDAWPDGFTAMFPGAPQSDYNSKVFLLRPNSPGGTVQIEGTTYNVNYNGSWGPLGPNDRLYWLLGLLCEALADVDSANLHTGDRWGPAFGGLHIYTGFSSNAAYSAGAFPKAFAEDILGVAGAPLTILQAWFAASTATNEGTAAAMGPMGPGGVSDVGDFYVGKGTLGPTIKPADVTGWWYLHQ
jgi:hypothetical protein